MFYYNLKKSQNFCITKLFSFTAAILDCVIGAVHVAG